jgi:threonine/homoserine/homoserine lactone efflux protein
MSSQALITFVVACVLLALTPGPNMALMIANTLSRGLGAGLVTLAGTATGLALLVAAAAIGITSIMVFMATWFDVVRWSGAVYLVWLGVRQLWRLRRDIAEPLAGEVSSAGSGYYLQGLAVSLSNPKVILFLGAFLPQFVDVAGDPVAQLAIFAVLFVVVLVAVDVFTVLAVAKARTTLAAVHLRLLDGAAGVLLVLGGLALAMVRRP